MRVRKKKPDYQTKIAKERMEKLVVMARACFVNDAKRSERYVGLAKKLGMRYNVRLPQSVKMEFCKTCNSILVPGRTSQVRLDSKGKAIVIKCLKCNRIYRRPYARPEK